MSDKPKVLFILAPAPRSGTNYLHDLLALHPAIKSSAVQEDHLLAEFHTLDRFIADSVGRAAIRVDEKRVEEATSLRKALGGALAGYIVRGAPSDSAFVISKSPTLHGVEFVDYLGLETRVLVVLRDGRDVVESTVRSFPQISPSYALHRWTEGCRLLAKCALMPRDRLMVVRYEEAFRSPAKIMEDVLAWLGLPITSYPSDKLDSLPVRGSSETKSRSREVTWRPVARAKTFAPDKRSAQWSTLQIARFQVYADVWNQAIGYHHHERPANIALKAVGVLQHCLDSLVLRLRRSRRSLVARDVRSFPPCFPSPRHCIQKDLEMVQRLAMRHFTDSGAAGTASGH
jgi:hypothetical protein